MSIVWDFIQNQVLGMEWLNDIIGLLLSFLGFDLSERIGSSIQFFIYDTVKISILLVTLIFIISYIQTYFPGKNKKNIVKIQRYCRKYNRSSFRYCNTVLFLFFNSYFYWIYKCRTAVRHDFFFSHIFPLS